jgi:hypothetical protein
MRPRTLAYLFGVVYLLLLLPNVFLFSSLYQRFMHRPEEQPLALVIGLVLELSAFLLTVVSAQYGSRVSMWFKTGAYLALVIVWVVCGLEVYVRNPLGYIWDSLPPGTSSFARFAFAVMGSITALFTVILGHAMGQMMRLEMGASTQPNPVKTVNAPIETTLNTPDTPSTNPAIDTDTDTIVQWARERQRFTVLQFQNAFGLSKRQAQTTLERLNGHGLTRVPGVGWRVNT